MRGSLSLKDGVLYVGSEEKTAHVALYDLDGRRLEPGFSFRGPGGVAAAVDGLAVDADHRVWIADGVGGRLVAFSIFGGELAKVEGARQGDHDGLGYLGSPVDVVSVGSDLDQELFVASGGRRRHAVQVLPLGEGRTRSLRPLGRPDGRWQGVRGIAVADRTIWVCEGLAGRVQVLRDEEFHFAFAVPVAGAGRFEPNAVHPLPDGRLLLAHGGAASAVLLLDRGGRLLRVLAESGTAEGRVFEPGDLAVLPGADDRHTRLAVIDRDGLRVQVFNLAGDCHGTLPGMPCSSDAWSCREEWRDGRRG